MWTRVWLHISIDESLGESIHFIVTCANLAGSLHNVRCSPRVLQTRMTRLVRLRWSSGTASSVSALRRPRNRRHHQQIRLMQSNNSRWWTSWAAPSHPNPSPSSAGEISSRPSISCASCRRSASARRTAICCWCSTSRRISYAKRSRCPSENYACTRSSCSRTRCRIADGNGGRPTCASLQPYISTAGPNCAMIG